MKRGQQTLQFKTILGLIQRDIKPIYLIPSAFKW